MITIHEATASDFSGLGLGVLAPVVCEIEEEAGGMFELRMSHPMDADGKWRNIAEYRIIKAPAPVRETPLVELQTGTEVYQVNVNTHLRLRSEPSTSTGKVVGRYRDGTRVVKIGESGEWYEVIVQEGGATGWMHSDYLEFVESLAGTPENSVQPRQTRDQLFRIAEVELDDEARMVSLTALHITYDLLGNIVKNDYSPENASPAAVCRELMARTLNPHGFHVYCTAEGKVTGNYGRKNIISALLDTETGVLKQCKANLVRDNMDIFILADEKRNRGVEIRHGNNLIGALLTVDASSVVTRIVPVGSDKNGNPLYLDGDGYVDSPISEGIPVVRAEVVQYGVKVVRSSEANADEEKFATEAAARARLRELAEKDFIDGKDRPLIGLEVDFVALEQPGALDPYAQLQSIHLYDVVRVVSGRSGIDASLRATGYVWDVLANGGRGRYSSVVLGEMRSLGAMLTGVTQNSALIDHVEALSAVSRDLQQKVEEMPEALPSPAALQFTGAVTATYDGSAAVHVEIPEAYSHPSYTARTGVPTADQTPGFGGTFSISQPVSDATGHITAINSRKITIPSTAATTSAAGLMSPSDKEKLNGVAAGANKYEHPLHGAIIGGPLSDQTPGFGATFEVGAVSSDNEGHVTGIVSRTVKIPNATATTDAAGLMSSSDKEALDNLPGKIAGKADAEHGHEIADVNGLQSVLAGKADVHEYIGALTGNPTSNQTPGFGSTFTVSQVKTDDAGHVTSLTSRTVKIPNSTATASAAGLMSPSDKEALDNLPGKIAGKADAEHGHEIADVSGLQSALDGKEGKGAATSALNSAKSYTDSAIATLIGSADSTMDTLGEIQTAMQDNADVVEALDEAIGKKANAADLTAHAGNVSNPHKVSLGQLGVTATAAELNYVDGVTSSIQKQLDGKAASEHGHEIADVEGLQNALAGKANVHEYIGAMTGNPTANATPGFGGTFAVSQVKTDDAGHVTSLTSRNITIPSTAATTSVAGLMSAADKTKLDGIAEGANKIVVDTALSSSSANPVQNKAVHSALAGKSDTGHTHSAYANQNAFSNVKVGETTIAAESTTDTLTLVAGDNVTLTPDATNDKVTIAAKDTVYTHPTYTARTGVPTADQTPGFGGSFNVSQPVSDASGHVTAVNSRKITIPSTAATTSAAGLMSAADKTKLDGIATGANKITVDSELSSASSNPVANSALVKALAGKANVHEYIGALTGVPTAAQTPAFGGTFAVNQVTTDDAGHVTALTSRNVTIPSTAATTSAAGLMSAADKTKLDGIATGANKITVDSALSSTSTNPVQNKVVQSALAGKSDTDHAHSAYLAASSFTNANLGQGYGTCATAAATAAKVVTLSGYTLTAGGVVTVKFTYAVPAGATMNINSKGAKAIYYRGAAIIAGIIEAGDAATFIYDGTRYHLLTVDRHRFFSLLVPYGVAIGADVDLNTTAYMKVGNYYCAANATAKTLVNCPTTSAFMMTVASPLSTSIDNETTGTWVYRLRKLQVYTGEEFVQYCYAGGTAGTWTYGPWLKSIKSNNTATTSAAGLMSAADKVKLDGIEANANMFVEPYIGELTGNPTANQTPGFGSTFSVSQVKTDSGGRVTALTSRTVKIPNTAATTSAAGLMSAADKVKLDDLPTNDKLEATYATADKGVYYIEGSGSATSVWKGSHSDITAYYSGLAILYKNDATGASDVETTLNINSLGAVTVKRNTSTTITTHYPIGSVILLTYTEDSGTAYFKTADYDANNYAYVRQYYTTAANNYPLLTKYDAGTSTTTSYVTKYSRYSNKFYANPSTGVLTAPTFNGDLTGNADTATKLAAAKTISLTGGVTGSGSFDGSANLSIAAALGATAATNLDTIISSGAHFGFYTTTSSTTGSPYAAGVTGWAAALVLSYGSSANNAVQVAFSAGTNKIFVRQRASGTTGSWTTLTPS